jgi:hypothetical protein
MFSVHRLRTEISVILADGVMSMDDWCYTFRDSVKVLVQNAIEYGTTRCLETSGTSHPVMRCHVTEELRSQPHGYESLNTGSLRDGSCNLFNISVTGC